MMFSRCAICGAPSGVLTPYCSKHGKFRRLAGQINDAERSDFVDEETGHLSRFSHQDWMTLDVFANHDEKETLWTQIEVFLAVYGWRLEAPWGTLPGDGYIPV